MVEIVVLLVAEGEGEGRVVLSRGERSCTGSGTGNRRPTSDFVTCVVAEWTVGTGDPCGWLRGRLVHGAFGYVHSPLIDVVYGCSNNIQVTLAVNGVTCWQLRRREYRRRGLANSGICCNKVAMFTETNTIVADKLCVFSCIAVTKVTTIQGDIHVN